MKSRTKLIMEAVRMALNYSNKGNENSNIQNQNESTSNAEPVSEYRETENRIYPACHEIEPDSVNQSKGKESSKVVINDVTMANNLTSELFQKTPKISNYLEPYEAGVVEERKGKKGSDTTISDVTQKDNPAYECFQETPFLVFSKDLAVTTKDACPTTTNEYDDFDTQSYPSEDDDDSVKDPNYHSSSSSSSSSSKSKSSCSSRSSSSSSSVSCHQNNSAAPEPENANVEEIKDPKEAKKIRKRIRKETEWIKTKSKILRNLGKQYVSCAKTKKVVLSKKVQPACGEKCRYKCSQKITEEQRLQIFNEFYGLSDINKKRGFINRNMEYVKPIYRYPNPNNRRLNNSFQFQIEQEKIRVCKLFFKRTLDINDRTIDTVVKKRTSTGSVSDDKKGRHGKHRKVDNNIRNDIREYINSIPRIESHYLRAQTSKEFIEGGKTIAELHREYKLQCETANKSYGNYHLFSDIFNTEFNISFYVPKKDQCNFCFIYNNADECQKDILKLEYEKHQEEKILSRIEKEMDKKKCNKNFIVACYDMQAVFQIPKGELSVFYYRSKLNAMNLTVTSLVEDETWCFVCHEGEGGKGVTEVASCILHYLQHKAESSDSDDLEITLYSDNCAAQQKNRFLIAALMYAVQKFQIKEITQKFLIMEHTQNEGDSTHSTIEKQVSRSLKSGPIYVPDQFIQILRNAKKKGEPFHVRELTHEDFFNIKQLMSDLGSNFNINSDGEQLVINDLRRVVKVGKLQPFKFFYKTSFADDQFKIVNVLERKRPATKRTRLESNEPSTPTLKKAYNSKRLLNEKKNGGPQVYVNKEIHSQIL